MGNPEPLREELADCGLGLLLRQRFADLVHAFGDGVVISTFEIGDDLASTIVLALRHTRNRGDSGIVVVMIRYRTAGNRLEHQHPLPGFEACDLIAITTGRGLEGVVDQLADTAIPRTIASWYIEPRRPRIAAGEISRDVGRGDD